MDENKRAVEEEREKWEDHRKEWHRNMTQMVRDIEKMQVTMERKVQLEFFNQCMEQKADKQMVVNATINKVSKIDLEHLLQSKCDKSTSDSAFHAI
jgi:uncharacterized phage-like protein YoqJ